MTNMSSLVFKYLNLRVRVTLALERALSVLILLEGQQRFLYMLGKEGVMGEGYSVCCSLQP